MARHPLFVIALAVIVLCCVRFMITLQPGYFFLVWNVVLAAAPLLWGAWFMKVRARPTKYRLAGMVMLGLLWLLFLPNAVYIITDFYHLNGDVLVNLRDYEARHLIQYDRGSSLYVFDSLLLLITSLFGLLASGMAMREFFAVARSKLSRRYAGLALGLVVVLSSIGVYIGRFGRFNSWDVFVAPHRIVMDLVHVVASPDQRAHFLAILTVALVAHLGALYLARIVDTRAA